MKILQVARYGSVRGGAETYVRSLCEGLRAAGHAVALAYGMEPDEDREEVREGACIPGLVEGDRPLQQDEDALGALMDRFRPDVVHVHVPDVPWVTPFVSRRAPALLAVHDHKLNCPTGTKYWTVPHRQCGVRPGPWCLAYNATAHCGSLRANLTLRPYRAWRRNADAARPAHVQVFSRHMSQILVSAGFADERVAVTHYPAPAMAQPFAPEPTDRRPIVFASGRLNKEKGFHELIDALARIRTPAHLVIAGAGHERNALEKRARTTAGPHRITFTGWISGGELTGWLRQAAVVAMPSVWPEPFGIAGLEAMVNARPVVAFASGGIPEWLVDGETGLLARPGDVIGLASAMDRLLNDPEERARMGEAGAARAATEFSLAGHVARVVALYERVRAL